MQSTFLNADPYIYKVNSTPFWTELQIFVACPEQPELTTAEDTEDEPTGLTELIVAKHRNGPTGKVELYFENHSTRFVNLD